MPANRYLAAAIMAAAFAFVAAFTPDAPREPSQARTPRAVPAAHQMHGQQAMDARWQGLEAASRPGA
jgi:hypothetical protein